MIKQVPRLLFRSCPSRLTPPARRLLSTAPPAQRPRSWKNSAVRWGIGIGTVYYYNTSDLFAEEPPFAIPPPQTPTEETSLQTLESIAPRRTSEPSTPQPPSENPNITGSLPPVNEGLEATEEQAGQEGAFNEETGEINWDCPCLGGMAHGPCGEQFRAAFSCFVFSKDEPKGMDCIDNFKNMQGCFREHPDIYGAELEDDEASEDSPIVTEGGETPSTAIPTNPESKPAPSESGPPLASRRLAAEADTQRAQEAKKQVENTQSEATSESDTLVPKAAHDATTANTGN